MFIADDPTIVCTPLECYVVSAREGHLKWDRRVSDGGTGKKLVDDRSEMRVIRTILASLLLTLNLMVPTRASERESVLRSLREMFGAPVDVKVNLFEVNRFYVLRVQFDRRERLSELAVEPKYYFEQNHPDWEEPSDFAFLSKAEYESLLLRLDKIRPRGHLLRASSVSVVTNLTAHHKDVYQNAVLVWGELVDLRRGENPPLQVRWFRLQFSGTHR